MTQTSLGPVVGSNRTARGAVARTGGTSGWSTSARWEGCTKATATPRINHILRDVEEEQGLYREHSNELIDPTLTSSNFSFTLEVGPGGKLIKNRITDVRHVFAHLEAGLAKAQRYRTIPDVRRVKVLDAEGKPIPLLDADGAPVLDKKGKPEFEREEVAMPNAGEKVPIKLGKDTVVAVEELFQLDPEWTGPIEGMAPEKREEIQRLYDVWYGDLVDQYGAHNILCVSEHWDETSPHVSAFCMPLADRGDGTAELNVKLFTTGKKKPTRTEARAAYVAKHDRLREALREADYEATFERITPRDEKGFAGKGAPLANFKRAAARATAEREQMLDEREAAVEEREGAVSAGEKSLTERVEEFDAKAAAKVKEVNTQVEELNESNRKLAKREADLEAREAEVAAKQTEIDEMHKAMSQSVLSTAAEEVAAKEARAEAEREAQRIVADAQAQADQAKTDALADLAEREESVRARELDMIGREHEAGKTAARLKEEWERDEKPALVAAAKKEGRDEAAGIVTAAKTEAATIRSDAKSAAAALLAGQQERTERAVRAGWRSGRQRIDRAAEAWVEEQMVAVRRWEASIAKLFRAVPENIRTPEMAAGYERYSGEKTEITRWRDALLPLPDEFDDFEDFGAHPDGCDCDGCTDNWDGSDGGPGGGAGPPR